MAERLTAGLAFLSGGFRPFFLFGAAWAALVVPLWLGMFVGHVVLPTAMPPVIWHGHEAVYGYGAAVVAGFLLTAVPNWTGRLPLRGGRLALLALLWAVGRLAVLLSGWIGATPAAVLDLLFPATFLAAVAREIIAGRNWRNLPVTGALALLLIGNALTHLGGSETQAMGVRLGVATLLVLIGLIGGRIVPSFTRNWLARRGPGVKLPAPFDTVDRIGMGLTVLALLVWVLAPDSAPAPFVMLAGGAGAAARLARWRGGATLGEPLLWVLHLGYAWLAVGLLLLALSGFWPAIPATAALHALTVGAIGTMTLAVMTRASLGHTGRPLTAGRRTRVIYVLISLAALLRLVAPLTGGLYLVLLLAAAIAWSGAFGLFALAYGGLLTRPRPAGGAAPI